MKTLQDIKDEYAQDYGYEDWEDLYRRAGYYDERVFFMHEDSVIVLAQKEALKKAAENVKTKKTGNSGSYFDASIDRTSITNPENLIQ